MIVPKGTVLRQDYIPLIRSLGIDFIAVEDPYEQLQEPNTFISYRHLKSFVNQVQRLMEKHIYHAGKPLYEFEMIANEIAKKLHLNLKKQYEIAVGCLLHDIGIRYITTNYVNREWESADPMEVFEFKKHTILGYSALDEEAWIPENAKKMILFHHEKLDGSGFPMRQKNHGIECKIIQACDFLDCKISGMECQRMSVQDALKLIQKEAGTKFDMEIVDTLVSIIARYPAGTTVKMEENVSILQVV